MDRKRTRRKVQSLGKREIAPVSPAAPHNANEYRFWLQEQAIQLDELLGFGDELVRKGLMSATLQDRAELDLIVQDLFNLLRRRGIDLSRKVHRPVEEEVVK